MRICLTVCAFAVAAGRLLACNHSVQHGDKGQDSRERSDREQVGEGRAGGAGPWRLRLHPAGENQERRLGHLPPCPRLCSCPRHLIS